MTRSLWIALVALSLALTACKTTEQKLVDRRRELRSTLDQAYADYTAGAGKAEQGGDGGVLGHVTGQVDRAYFENQCLATGRGERGLPLSARLDAFLREERNARACRKAADLKLEVEALERKVSGDRR